MEQVRTADLRDPSTMSPAELDRASREHGFFLVLGHDADDLIDRIWAQTRRLFAADPAVRRRIIRSEENPLGYFDRQPTKRGRDHKEAFDFIDPDRPARFQRNRWPVRLDGFEDTMTEFFGAMVGLATEAARLVHRALGPAGSRRPRERATGSTARPFPWRELMKGWADDNARDLGTDDIQISRFRV